MKWLDAVVSQAENRRYRAQHRRLWTPSGNLDGCGKHMRIGIDLTCELAHIKCGMGNIVQGYICGLNKVLCEDTALLLTTPANKRAYKKYRTHRIRLKVTSAASLGKEVKALDVVYFPFNEIYLEDCGVPRVVQIHDLIPEEFRDRFPQSLRQRRQRDCRDASIP